MLPILFALKNAQPDCKCIKGSKQLPPDTRAIKSQEILKTLPNLPKLNKVISEKEKVTNVNE